MNRLKKADPVFNSFHLLRICALAAFLLVTALALAVVPGFCSDMRPVQLAPLLLWSAADLCLLMLWMYAKHRDPRLLMSVGERYPAYQFLCEPHFCSRCGTRRILVFSGLPERPVLPNTLLRGQKTSYYCPRCRDAAAAHDCIPSKVTAHRLSPQAYRGIAETSLTAPCRPSSRYVRLHGSLLLICGIFCAAAAWLVRLYIVFLALWWAALYLLFLFFYHTLDNLTLSYQITDAGILQRSLFGLHLLRWEEINQLTDIATQGNSGQMTVVFAQSGNRVLSPVLVDYAAFVDCLKEMCRKHRIPYYHSPSH